MNPEAQPLPDLTQGEYSMDRLTESVRRARAARNRTEKP